MKDEIKQILEAKGWKIKNETLVNKVLWSFKWRFNKHWKIIFSRKEFNKFWTTERKLRWVIDAFRWTWLLEQIWKERKDGNRYYSNVYSISEELKSIFDKLVWGIKDLYKKVWEFVSNNWIEVLKDFWIKLFNEKRKLIEKKISFGKRWQIKNWKTWKWYNIFSYLMEKEWFSCFELASKLKL